MSKLIPISKLDTIVIHCSATPNDHYFDAVDIDDWHKKRGFKRDPGLIDPRSKLKHIGYHFVVDLFGRVAQGRGIDYQSQGKRFFESGAHAINYNSQSIGICMIGTDKFTQDQWTALRNQVQALQNKFTGIQRIVGHRDLSPDLNKDGKITSNEWVKTCPGFDVSEWLDLGLLPLDGHVLECK